MAKAKLIPKVNSLADLRSRAQGDERYVSLAKVAASNLGRTCDTLESALDWLRINAQETDEKGVVDEINAVRDLI